LNIRASLVAVVVMVVGLAAVIIISVEKDFPLFRDLLGVASPSHALTGARVDSRIDIDTRMVTTRFEIDLRSLADQEPSHEPSPADRISTLIVELPPDTVVQEAGMRFDDREFKGTYRSAPDGSDKMILDAVRWSLLGNDHVLIEVDPKAPQFMLWMKMTSFLMPHQQPNEGRIVFPRIAPLNVEVAFAPVPESQPALDVTAPRSEELVAPGAGRVVNFARHLSAKELSDGLTVPVAFDPTVHMVWTPHLPSADAPALTPEQEPILVVRFAEVPARPTLNLAKVIPANLTPAGGAFVEAKLADLQLGAAATIGKDLRSLDQCNEAAALAEAWQWAAAQVDSLVVWVPGAGAECQRERLAEILAPLAAELKRANGKPEIAAIVDTAHATSLQAFAPWLAHTAALTRGQLRRYRAEFATYERGSLPVGPEVVMATEALRVLWDFHVVNTATEGAPQSPEFLTAASPLAIARQ